MIDLSGTIAAFKRESVTLTRKGRVYNSASLSGYDAKSGTPSALTATVVQSKSRSLQLQEKMAYGSIALKFYFQGIVDMDEGDIITRSSDGFGYTIVEYSFREQGNYTLAVGVRNRQQGDETPV